MNNAIANLARPSFCPAMVDFLTNGDMEEIRDTYVDQYKEAHGIKARWVKAENHTREEFADMFERLNHEIEMSIAHDKAEAERFMSCLASVGLTEWAERHGIRSELDLMEHNYREECREREAA